MINNGHSKLFTACLLLCVWGGHAVAEDDLARAERIRKFDAATDRLCAGLFWSVSQCGALEFRAAQGQAFLTMARKAAALEGKPLPLTQDDAAHQMSEDLQGWLEEIGPACERFQQLPHSELANYVNLDMCARRLRGER